MSPLRSSLRPAAAALACLCGFASAFAQGNSPGFLPTSGGTYQFNSNAHWSDGAINGLFKQSLAAQQEVTFDADTTLTGGLTFELDGTSPLILRGSGGNRGLTLAGNIAMGGVTASIVYLGSLEDGQKLTVLLGAVSRVVDVGDGRTLVFVNDVTGAGGLTKTGAGTLTLLGSASYTGGTTVSGGVFQVGDGVTDGTLAGDVAIETGATLAFNAASSTTFSGALSGVGTLEKKGSGAAILSGTGTGFTGVTDLQAGMLQIDATNALGTSTALEIADDGELHLHADQAVGSLAGSAGAEVTFNSGQTLTVNGSASTTFSGAISGSGSLAKSGTGTLTLGGVNAFTGGTTITGGTLTIAADSALGAAPVTATPGHLVLNGGTLKTTADVTLAANRGVAIGSGGGTFKTETATTLTYGGIITGDTLTKSGGGTLVLTGANAYNGPNGAGTIIDAGTLTLGNTTGNTLATGADVTINGSGVLEVDNNQTIRALLSSSPTSGVVVAGGKTLTANLPSSGSGASGTFLGVISGGGSFTKDGPGLLELGGDNTFAGTTTVSGGTLYLGTGSGGSASGSVAGNIVLGPGAATLGFNRSNSLLSPYVYAGTISGSGTVAFFGNGHVKLTGTSTYSGATTVENGTLVIGASNALPTATEVTLNTNGSLRVEENQTIAGLSGVGGAEVLSGKKLTVATAAGGTYQGAISGGGSFEKGGAGMLTLTGTSTYEGSTTISGGILKVASANALPTTSEIAFGAGTTLKIFADQTIRRIISSVSSSAIVIDAGDVLKIDLNTNSAFAGVISDSGKLHVGGGSDWVLTLSNNNSYSGGTEIDADTVLQLGAGGTTGMIAGNVVNNGLLAFARSDDVTFGGAISGSGAVKVMSGSGAVFFSGPNSYQGGTTVYGGRLLATNTSGSATGSGSVTVYTGAVFGGSGAISGGLTVMTGGTVAPGTNLGNPESLEVGSAIFNAGGAFAFQIRDANGTGVTDLSLLSISGALAINATTSNPFVINLYTLNGTAAGQLANFDTTQAYNWMFASAGGGITGGFDAAKFTVNTSNFLNSFSGSFGVTNVGNDLFVQFTPAAVPEPATWALLVLGLGAVWLAGRRVRSAR